MITVSVPGKIHLMGEHAVVYGKPAILAAINLRMQVSIEHASSFQVHSIEPPEYASYAVEKVYEFFHISKIPPISVTITSDIPAGFHLGSSAATAVGVVAATVYMVKHLWNPEQINTIAYEVEKKQHGNPSGGDNTVATFGGLVWYRKELEFLKSMWQLPVSFPSEMDHLYLMDTGRPHETTGDMVALVRSEVSKQKDRYQKIFDENEEQCRRIAVALKEKNESNFIDAMRKGEQTLEKMGVVSRKVLPVIREIETTCGGAKILGGGGKKEGVGYILCYAKDKKKLERISKKYHYAVQKITLGTDGVKLERKE